MGNRIAASGPTNAVSFSSARTSGPRRDHAVAGQILNGLLSIVCFALVGVAFWRFGWKVGVINLALLFIASNVGLTSGRNLWPVIIGHGLFDASRFILFYFEGPPTG